MKLNWREYAPGELPGFKYRAVLAAVDLKHTAQITHGLNPAGREEIYARIVDFDGLPTNAMVGGPFGTDIAAKRAVESYLDRHTPSGARKPRPEPKKDKDAGKLYPRTGYYANDCPFCHTHNALLSEHVGLQEFMWQCRDCKRWFQAVGDDQWRVLPGKPSGARFSPAGGKKRHAPKREMGLGVWRLASEVKGMLRK